MTDKLTLKLVYTIQLAGTYDIETFFVCRMKLPTKKQANANDLIDIFCRPNVYLKQRILALAKLTGITNKHALEIWKKKT